MDIKVFDETQSKEEKQSIARTILEALPEWFGLTEPREKYISDAGNQMMTVAFDGEKPVGFLSLEKTGSDTVELHVMGILKEYHRQHIGSELFQKARIVASSSGYSFMQVKTVKMGVYPEYDATNRFYISLGFKEFEVIPDLWGEENPCQIYVMSI